MLLGEILVRQGRITATQLEAALDAQRTEQPRLRLGQMLLNRGLLSEADLLAALGEQSGFPVLRQVGAELLDPELVRHLPVEWTRTHLALPVRWQGAVGMLTCDPAGLTVRDDLALLLGCELQSILAPREEILRAIERCYFSKRDTAQELLRDMAEEAAPVAPPASRRDDLLHVAEQAPVTQLVNLILIEALKARASDIHIEPFEDPNGKNSKVLIRYRVDGMLRIASFSVPWAYRQAINAKIKIMSNSMNITERRIPQSGRIQIIAKGNPIEFRVEIVPTVYGESCVMRILDRASVRVDIKIMGFLPDTETTLLKQFQGIGGKKNFGLMLVCGPTGSGKSTTLYGCLNYVNRPDIKILTAENPVEYNIDGIVQVPVNPDIKEASAQAERTSGPSTLDWEKRTNIFLLSNSARIKAAVASPGASPGQVFALLRRRKDVF